jgi:hypothetical protein
VVTLTGTLTGVPGLTLMVPDGTVQMPLGGAPAHVKVTLVAATLVASCKV